jgi:heat shock protein HtpX
MMLINKGKTALLMALLAGLLMLLGHLIAGSTGLTIACCIALIMNGILYFFSDKIVLKLHQAHPFDSQKYPDIEPMVRALSTHMGLPMPRLWIIKTPLANAFATGRNPRNASIAFTTGILELLDPHEIRGVIAHELSHIYHRDILVITMAATLATAIGYITNMIQHKLFFEALDGRSQKKSYAGMIITVILMPFIALLIRLSISRSREYLADEMGAHACHDPLALASALQKLHNHTEHVSFQAHDTVRSATAGLFIVNPFSAQDALELFSTHPSVNKRVAALHKLYATSRRWSL